MRLFSLMEPIKVLLNKLGIEKDFMRMGLRKGRQSVVESKNKIVQ